MSRNWFSLSAPTWWLPWMGRRVPVKLWSCFRRGAAVWGIGLLFIARHHLFYVGDAGVTIGFRRIIATRSMHADDYS